MAASNDYQQLIAGIGAPVNLPGDSVATVREKMAPLHGHPVSEETEVSYIDSGVLRAAWLRAAQVASEPVTHSERFALFCHGGAFVSCDMNDYLFYGEWISRFLDCRVLIPDYRLAPEHLFPAAAEDCLACYRLMLEQGINPDQIVVIGDSCGGGLGLAVLLQARDEGLAMPACFVGLTGWYDLLLRGQSGDDPGGPDPFITPGWYRDRAADYLGSANARNPLASPVFADCENLPPMLLQAGGADITRDSAVEMARVARDAAVDVTLEVWPDMCHGWHGLLGAGVPESTAAWESAVGFVARYMP